MGEGRRDVELTVVEDEGASEEVRLLDAYDDVNFEDSDEVLRRIQVGVTGMTCAACSNSVEGALRSVNGVLTASVALLQNRADVVFDPRLVKVSQFSVFFFFGEANLV